MTNTTRNEVTPTTIPIIAPLLNPFLFEIIWWEVEDELVTFEELVIEFDVR